MTREDALRKMNSFRYRANVMVVDYRINDASKPIIIYDDHRYLLNVLFYAKQEGVFDDAVNLIYFDLHDDAAGLGQNERTSMENIRAEINKNKDNDVESSEADKNEAVRKFNTFVEFDVNADDGSWLITGMELGLINNAVNIGGKYTDRIGNLNSGYHESHYIGTFPIHKFDNEIEKKLLDKKIDTEKTPFVLDFDLDCFNGYTEDTFCQELVQNKPVYECIKGWISRASFITICREPMCCEGRVFGSTEKLGYLDKYFFDNAIRGC